MTGPRVVLTRHAENMLAERNIDSTWVTAAIRNPDATEADPNRPNVLRAFRRIPEREDRFLRVVYVPDGDTVRVLTAFFDRNR